LAPCGYPPTDREQPPSKHQAPFHGKISKAKAEVEQWLSVRLRNLSEPSGLTMTSSGLSIGKETVGARAKAEKEDGIGTSAIASPPYLQP